MRVPEVPRHPPNVPSGRDKPTVEARLRRRPGTAPSPCGSNPGPRTGLSATDGDPQQARGVTLDRMEESDPGDRDGGLCHDGRDDGRRYRQAACRPASPSCQSSHHPPYRPPYRPGDAASPASRGRAASRATSRGAAAGHAGAAWPCFGLFPAPRREAHGRWRPFRPRVRHGG